MVLMVLVRMHKYAYIENYRQLTIILFIGLIKNLRAYLPHPSLKLGRICRNIWVGRFGFIKTDNTAYPAFSWDVAISFRLDYVTLNFIWT